jgi:predicted ATP-binding protein involved in virulence
MLRERMRIRSLTLKNFRGFENATLDLDRPLTVLFGVNGSGKSSVLEATAIALGASLLQAHPRSNATVTVILPADTDVRRGARALEVHAVLMNGEVTRTVEAHHPPIAVQLPDLVLMQLYASAPALYAYYSSTRTVATAGDAFASEGSNGAGNERVPPPAIRDSLGVGHLKFRSFFQWFKDREEEENALKVREQNFGLDDPQLTAVRRAIAGMLPAGFSELRVERHPIHMVVQKGDATLAIDQLSDGEKLLLALTADLARRLAMVYAASTDPLEGEAIVLIDEIELHLHPSWQRTALAKLRSTFPNCQFIVTTHSPQVLSEVPNDAVFLVQDFQFYRPGAPTAGRDSNAILAEAMDTPERPSAQLAAIREVSKLLDEGKHAEARAKLDALAGEISEIDREVVTLRNMLHFLEGVDAAHQKGA